MAGTSYGSSGRTEWPDEVVNADGFPFFQEGQLTLKDEHYDRIHKAGIVLRKGVFSPKEDAMIRKNWKEFALMNDLTYESIREHLGINVKGTVVTDEDKSQRRDLGRWNRSQHFVAHLSANLLRTGRAVYLRARALFDNPAAGPLGFKSAVESPYTPEELKRLLTLRRLHGDRWVLIGSRLGRPWWCVRKVATQLGQPPKPKLPRATPKLDRGFFKFRHTQLQLVVIAVTGLPDLASAFVQRSIDSIDWQAVTEQMLKRTKQTYPKAYAPNSYKSSWIISKLNFFLNRCDESKIRNCMRLSPDEAYAVVYAVHSVVKKSQAYRRQHVDWTEVLQTYLSKFPEGVMAQEGVDTQTLKLLSILIQRNMQKRKDKESAAAGAAFRALHFHRKLKQLKRLLWGDVEKLAAGLGCPDWRWKLPKEEEEDNDFVI